MEFSLGGLPLHPLLVHVVIALVPLSALAVLLHVLWPAARRRLGIVTPLAGLGVLIAVPVTIAAGRALKTAVGSFPAVDRHANLGSLMLPAAIGLFAVSVAVYVWFRWRDRVHVQPGVRRGLTIGLGVVATIVALASLVLLVLVGDSGARAVWGGFVG